MGVAKVKFEQPVPGDVPHFERLFISFKTLIDGFKAGCRPIIGLDGCHIEHYFGGYNFFT